MRRERVLSRRYVLAGGETGPFRRRWEAQDQYRAKSLQREVVRPIWELKSESQNGNSGFIKLLVHREMEIRVNIKIIDNALQRSG